MNRYLLDKPAKLHVYDLTVPILGEKGLADLQQMQTTVKDANVNWKHTDAPYDLITDEAIHRIDLAEAVEAKARFRPEAGIELKNLSLEALNGIKKQLREEEEGHWARLHEANPEHRDDFISGRSIAKKVIDVNKDLDSARIRLFRMELVLTETSQSFAAGWKHSRAARDRHDLETRSTHFYSHLLNILNLQRAVLGLVRELHVVSQHEVPREGQEPRRIVKVFKVDKGVQAPMVLQSFEHCLAVTIVTWLLPVWLSGENKFFRHPEEFKTLLHKSIISYKDQHAKVESEFRKTSVGRSQQKTRRADIRKKLQELKPRWVLSVLGESLLAYLKEKDGTNMLGFQREIEGFYMQQKAIWEGSAGNP